MLMLLMALSLVSADIAAKRPDCYPASYRVKSPAELGIFKTGGVEVSLIPNWQSTQIAVQNSNSFTSSNASNLEQWRNLSQAVNVEDLAPRFAVQMSGPPGDWRRGYEFCERNTPNNSVNALIGFTNLKAATSLDGRIYLSDSHYPWHIALQQKLPEQYSKHVLVYELVKTPTSQKPYYEAFACSMPNIRCRAKTIESLKEQLLQQYSQYLVKMLQDEEDFPHQQQKIRPEQQGLNGAFIAWLIGATPEEKKPEITQVFTFTTAVDYP